MHYSKLSTVVGCNIFITNWPTISKCFADHHISTMNSIFTVIFLSSSWYHYFIGHNFKDKVILQLCPGSINTSLLFLHLVVICSKTYMHLISRVTNNVHFFKICLFEAIFHGFISAKNWKWFLRCDYNFISQQYL